jgi:hypothetical protein
MKSTLFAIVSAFVCVILRSILNSIDRLILKSSYSDFLSILIYNAIFTLVFSGICIFFAGDPRKAPIFEINSIMIGLASQVASSAYSFALKKIPVRGVISANKAADLIIPFIPFILVGKFKTDEYVFSNLTTLALLPIGLSAVRLSQISWDCCTILILGLIFQATVVEVFSQSQSFSSFALFSEKVFCILFWRTLFILLPLLYRLIKPRTRLQVFPLLFLMSLCGKGYISFLSQMTFFWSVMGQHRQAIWPDP